MNERCDGKLIINSAEDSYIMIACELSADHCGPCRCTYSSDGKPIGITWAEKYAEIWEESR